MKPSDNPLVKMFDAYEKMLDPEFRQKLREQDADALAEIGFVPLEGLGDPPQIKVVTSTRDTTYMPLMPVRDDAHVIPADELNRIAAAGSAGSASTVASLGCASTFACLCGSFSSVGTMSTAGTAGTAGTG